MNLSAQRGRVEESGGGARSVSTLREKEGEGAGTTTGSSGRLAMAPGCRAQAAPCRVDKGARGLTGGPRPQCRAAAPADRRAWAAQCWVQTDSK
jgi:hypothetical protein